jgi:hypothetical protein
MKLTTTQLFFLAIFMTIFSACSGADEYVPAGRWEVMAREEVYKENNHPLTVAFILEKGEVCAVSDKVLIRKDVGYRKISCPQGDGWIFSTLNFKKIS